MWDCPFHWYHFYNIELQQITAKTMVTKLMIRQPRKTVQQDQAELRMGQWMAFVNSIWKEIKGPQKYTIRREKSKMFRDEEDDSNPGFDLIRSISSTICQFGSFIFIPTSPRNKTKTNSHEKLKIFINFYTITRRISIRDSKCFQQNRSNQKVWAPNPVLKTTEIAKNMHVKKFTF